MEDTTNPKTSHDRHSRNAIKEWLFLDIEGNELLFVLLSFLDAKLTSMCLQMGGLEAVPWMKGLGSNVAMRMAVATAIMLYLKMRGLTRMLWFGILVLFIVAVWNFFMLILISFGLP
jgi:hypothetical protein